VGHKVVTELWNDAGYLDKCEKLRKKQKKRGKRLTYDCVHAAVKGDRVRCQKSRILDKLSNDGSMYIVGVLEGRTSYACLKCIQYEEGE
jgi:hypothetical protein